MSGLVDFLSQSGYQRIPLSRNGVGHFQASGAVEGSPITVLIDTGAASTLLDVGVARRLGLGLTKLDAVGGGAGGTGLELFVVEGAELRLGSFVPRTRALVAMDLAHVNSALAMKGASPIEAILGVDVFDAHAGVIDYGSQSLFLLR